MHYIVGSDPTGVGGHIAQLNQHTNERVTQLLSGFEGIVGRILPATTEASAGDLMGRVQPQLLTPLKELLRSALTEAPSNLVDGTEIALYKKVRPLLSNALTTLIRNCEEEENGYFANAQEEFQEKVQLLASCNEQDVEALRAAVFTSLNVFKKHKVHIFGETFNGNGNIPSTHSFAKLAKKPPRVQSNASLADRVSPVQEVSHEQKEAFKAQRDALVRNLKRIALVEIVYQFVIGKSTNHLKELFSRESAVDFEKGLFSCIDNDVADYSWPYRMCVWIVSYLLYKVASFVLDPCFKQAGHVGYDAVNKAIAGLNKPEQANALHDHIFDSLKNYLDDMRQGYEVVASKRAAEGARGLSIHEKVLKFFENSPSIHLGRTKEAFYGEVVDHIVKHLPLLYPIRLAIGCALKRGGIMESLFSKVETMKKDKEAFSFAVDKAFASVLEHLEEKLREEDDENEDVGEVSKLKREQIHSFFETLFDAISLVQLPTGRALEKHLQIDSQSRETYDSTVREKLLSPAAKGAADSFAFAIKGALTPELVQKTMNLFLEVLNSGYQGEEEVTQEMREQAREGLSGVQSRLLDLSIEKGMEGIPLLYPQQEIEVANAFITTIRGQTEEFCDVVTKALEESDYRNMNDVWNSYVLALQTVEKKINKEKRLGDSIKHELRSRYLAPLASHMQQCNRCEKGKVVSFVSEEKRDAMEQLNTQFRESLEGMTHMLCYDFVGEGVAGMGRDSAKKIVKQILEKKADGLLSLALHPSMVPYGVGNYMLLRPYLLSQGVKDLTPTEG